MEKDITKQQILHLMKTKMLELKKYSASLRLRSIVYEEADTSLQVQDELIDYLHYTRSIVDCTKKERGSKEDRILTAMDKRDKHQLLQKQKDKEAFLLLQAMNELPRQERELLFDVYIRDVDRKMMLHRQGDIVESTYHRRLKRALLHLYELVEDIVFNIS